MMVAARPRTYGRRRPLLESLRRRQQHRQPRRLRGGQAGALDVEIVARGGLGAEHAFAPFDAVQIDLEDAVLRQQCFEEAVTTNSWPLRARLRSPPRNRFFASCCVIVEPPTIFGARAAAVADGRAPARCWSCWSRSANAASACWLRSQAFSRASHSTPLCSEKPASSRGDDRALQVRPRSAPTAAHVAPGEGAFCVDQAPRLGALEGRRLRVEPRHRARPERGSTAAATARR